MAPVSSKEGFWGKPTATIDWCESNYEVTLYIAEFWNTVSNVFLIILPLVGAVLCKKDKQEDRIFWCHIFLMVIGFGSTAFHGTLRYDMQLLDELPMIWGSSFLIYTLYEMRGKPNKPNKKLQIGLMAYCALVTVVYLTIENPIFHEAAYGLMVFSMVVKGIDIYRHLHSSRLLLLSGMATYGFGFLLWNIDNIFCSKLRAAREATDPSLRPLLQFHAWWHVFTGTGTYLGILYGAHARESFLNKGCRIEIKWGCIPTVRSFGSEPSQLQRKPINNNSFKPENDGYLLRSHCSNHNASTYRAQ